MELKFVIPNMAKSLGNLELEIHNFTGVYRTS